jgi:hypothetical protein
LKTVMPASLASWSRAIMASETYEVVTTCFLALMAALMTRAWKV